MSLLAMRTERKSHTSQVPGLPGESPRIQSSLSNTSHQECHKTVELDQFIPISLKVVPLLYLICTQLHRLADHTSQQKRG